MPTHPIPHARHVFEKRQPPFIVLHVVTDMPVRSITPGFNAEDNDAMMRAIGPLIGRHCRYDRYVIHGPDQP